MRTAPIVWAHHRTAPGTTMCTTAHRARRAAEAARHITDPLDHDLTGGRDLMRQGETCQVTNLVKG
ncbi:hypothetical protein ACFY0G_41160 [Streptomyces sp. NPDC001552]|uniref:hypothetical protein n=1 Tax=Streptomyces sp. NPDC001552 TaxID=3364587 RepID=UPI003693A0A1